MAACGERETFVLEPETAAIRGRDGAPVLPE